MSLWLAILVVLMITTWAAFMYICDRMAKFGWVEKLADGNERGRRLIGVAIVLAVLGILWWTMNLMSAVICLLYLAIFWLMGDFIFGIWQKLRKKPFKYNYAGVLAIIVGVFYLAMGWYNNHEVWATHYTLKTSKLTEPLRVVMLADSHIGTTFDGQGFAKHLEKVQAQNPDMVMIVGDFVDDSTTRNDMIEASKALGNLQTKYGVFFAWGNHDMGYYGAHRRGFSGYEMAQELHKNGVVVLNDEAQWVGDNLYVIGRQDVSEFQRGRSRKSIDELVADLDKNKYLLVLNHQPNDYANETNAGVDLVLSGHTHGGQLFPLNKVGEWIGANDKTYGLERRGNTDFIVTSGISDWAIKFKTGTKSEFVVIDIIK